MGVVYKARQKTLNRLVALKLLAPERVGDTKFAERFAREAQALAALNHPNIVTIYDFGQAGGFYFLLMEFVDGANLRQLLRTRKFTPEEALVIVPPLCDALQFAHERGIVHRDIKPENLLLDKAGRIKVADFGIAKILDAGSGGGGGQSPAADNATQSAVGTPGYSAPEQRTDPQRVDNRADIYSLGVVFYEMLTGELPGQKIAPPSSKVHIDVRLDEIVLRALERKPELRYQQASAMKTQVEAITGNTNILPPVAGSLNQKRTKVIAWGLALTVAGAVMNPWLGIFAGLVFLVSAVMALAYGGDPKMLQMAKRLLAIDGMVMAAAAIWYACNTPELPSPWRIAIIVACVGGIGCCVCCLISSMTTGDGPTPQPGEKVRWRRSRKFFSIQLPVLLVTLLIVRTFFLQAFRTPTDAAAPEIPRGSQFLVWRLARTFEPGDFIVYRVEGHAYNVGRVVRNEDGAVVVNKNGHPDLPVPSGTIVGKVISVYWRASNEAPVPCLWPSSDGESGSFRTGGDQIEGRAMSLATLMSYAYGSSITYVHWSENRVILPPGAPAGKFDIQLQASDAPHETLQAAIKKQLGLVAHREVRDTDVLVLTVSDQSLIGLAVGNGGSGSDTGAAPGRNSFQFANMPIDDVSDFLEASLGKPVINETELTQKYSGSLKWNHQSDPAAELKEIQNVLSNRLGLQLVPRREPVEMLVVEKAR
jgi:uncharacterized protein (TIGR03435 family)